MPAENDALLSLVIHEVSSAIEGMKDKSRFEVTLAACRAGKDHFMVTDPNVQIKGVFGGLLDFYGEGSREFFLLECEIKAIGMLEAAEQRGREICGRCGHPYSTHWGLNCCCQVEDCHCNPFVRSGRYIEKEVEGAREAEVD